MLGSGSPAGAHTMMYKEEGSSVCFQPAETLHDHRSRYGGVFLCVLPNKIRKEGKKKGREGGRAENEREGGA